MLPVETGRWRRIRREDRQCHLCRLDIGDEYHYMLTLTVWLAEVLYACEKHDVAAGCSGYRTVNG